MIYKVLTIKQPWVYCIFQLGKDIENRSFKTNVRGKIAIHASKQIDLKAYQELINLGYTLPSVNELEVVKIIGTVEIVDCVKEHQSKFIIMNCIIKN